MTRHPAHFVEKVPSFACIDESFVILGKMAQIAKLRMLLSGAFGPAIAVLLLLSFALYAVLGPNGVLALGDYSRQLRDARSDLAAAEAEKAELANRVRLVDNRRADRDMVDELVRRQLNVVHPDEVVIPRQSHGPQAGK